MNFDTKTVFVVVDAKGEIIAVYSEMDDFGYHKMEMAGMRVVETKLWTPKTGK